MKRWNSRCREFQESPPEVENFLNDLETLFRKHQMVLGHEDGQGNFIIEPFDYGVVDWIREASNNMPTELEKQIKASAES